MWTIRPFELSVSVLPVYFGFYMEKKDSQTICFFRVFIDPGMIGWFKISCRTSFVPARKRSVSILFRFAGFKTFCENVFPRRSQFWKPA